MVTELRSAAGVRADELELAMTIFVVGDQAPPWIEEFLGADAATLIEHDSLAMLRGSSRQIADELLRRRDMLGVSYITVNTTYLEEMASVVELLDGR